jgi:hypothetical protein
MSVGPIDKHFGTPLSEWISAIPRELDTDAVGLWQIIPALRNDFGLRDVALERAIREVLYGLLARGAQPVVGASAHDGSWKRSNRYGNSATSIINGVVDEWHQMGRDPDVGDVWFALPRFFTQS